LKTRLANKLYTKLCAGEGDRYKPSSRRTATHIVFSRWSALVRQFGRKKRK
jgi:hypothetical protein